MKKISRILNYLTRSNSQFVLALLTSLSACLTMPENLIATVPGLISYQGRLTDATGTPVPNGAFFIRFQIYDAPVGGTSLWNSGIQPVQVTEGVYTYTLGQDVPFPSGLFSGSNRWLGITVGTDPELTPRKQLIATAYAFVSQNADSVEWSGIKNLPVGFADGVDNNSGGDITAVTASGGLTGGAASGDASLSIATGGVTSVHIGDGQIVDADISAAASIAATKVSGTAATLTGLNSFSATNTFDVGLRICDSVLYTNCNGITLGRDLAPSTTYLLQTRRNFNTSSARYGHYVNIENVSTGQLIGSYARVVATTVGDVNSGTVYGSYSLSESDNLTRFGSYANCSARDASLNTGTTYGAYASGSDGDHAYGVYGRATSSVYGIGVYGEAVGTSHRGWGVYGYANNNTGNAAGVLAYVENTTPNAYGVDAGADNNSADAFGIFGHASGNAAEGFGIYGFASNNALGNWAGYFSGNVNVTGTIFTPSLRTRIDHPLDPENLYLQQALVESPEMKSIYDGVVVLDATGSATIALPDYCESINKNFRYLLTPIGAAMPNLHVATEVASNQFSVAGGQPGEKISWQVTGVRKDPWAESNHVDVVAQKPNHERGKYIHPTVWGKSAALGSDYEHTKHAEAGRPSNHIGPDDQNEDQ